MKATLPPAICAVVILYSSWVMYRDRPLPRGLTASVEVVVRGPDGKVIPAVKRAEN